MGTPRRSSIQGRQADTAKSLGTCDSGPRNPDGTWVAGVVRGPYKPFPAPVGAIFGELTVVDWRAHTKSTGRASGWQPVVRCKCGWEGFVYRENLLKGRSTRCNTCAKIAAGAKRWWKYKDALPDDTHRTRLLNRLSSCIGRCHTPSNAHYIHYGERGITVCDEWRVDRTAFLKYVQTLNGWDNPTLDFDRIDTDGNYEPGNVRFVTRSENARNKRRMSDKEQLISALRKERDDLRLALRRAKKQIRDMERQRTVNSA
jgi:hypothetical protein